MILRRIEQYLKVHRVPPARFGRLAVRDPRLVFDLRNGREPRAVTERRIAKFLDQAERSPARGENRHVAATRMCPIGCIVCGAATDREVGS